VSAILKPVQMEVYDPDNVLAPPDEIVEKMGKYKIAFLKPRYFLVFLFLAPCWKIDPRMKKNWYQFFRIQEAYNMVLKHEEINNMTYDFVIRTRFLMR